MGKFFVKKLEKLMEDVKKNGEPDLSRAEKLCKVSRQSDLPELSDAWYENQAELFIHDFNDFRNDTQHWEETAVNAFVGSLQSAFGNIIDREKLFKAVEKKLKERDDAALALEKTGIAVNLKEVAQKLRREYAEEERKARHDRRQEQLIERHFAEDNVSQSDEFDFAEWRAQTKSLNKTALLVLEVSHGQEFHTKSRWQFLYGRELRQLTEGSAAAGYNATTKKWVTCPNCELSTEVMFQPKLDVITQNKKYRPVPESLRCQNCGHANVLAK